MAEITNKNLFSESYNVVETFLKSITDPKSRFKVNWIHPSMPQINATSFEGYPFMTLKVNVVEDNKTFDNATQKTFKAIITIYSDQATEIETICNEISEDFREESKLTDFESKLFDASPIDWTLDQKGKKILFREITLEMKNRI